MTMPGSIRLSPTLLPSPASGAAPTVDESGLRAVPEMGAAVENPSAIGAYPLLPRLDIDVTLTLAPGTERFDLGMAALEPLLSDPVSVGPAGFAQITRGAFEYFRDTTPHLFRDGLELIDSLSSARADLATLSDRSQSLDVITSLVNTAAITAPSDLWTLRQVIATYAELGITTRWVNGETFSIDELVRTRGWDRTTLSADFALLKNRGYIVQDGGGYKTAENDAARDALVQLGSIPGNASRDWTKPLLAVLEGTADARTCNSVEEFLLIAATPLKKNTWVASAFEMEIGYRLTPLVLALRALGRTQLASLGTDIHAVAPHASAGMIALLQQAGLLDATSRISALGARVLARGPGPMGIIHAYHPYMQNHRDRLTGQAKAVWVERAQNVAASQDANRRSFAAAIAALDVFCAQYSITYSTFIEHAVGRGEATRQYYQRHGAENIFYMGADLEEASLKAARMAQAEELLPQNMRLITADIGKPQQLLTELGERSHAAVMIVGNGFHEARNQTDASMSEIFRQYQEAGITLIFTEETRLSDEELLASAWNTYHAAFRYFHEISGQGLRPAFDQPSDNAPLSWESCARAGGYVVVASFCRATRPILPYASDESMQPVSKTYFCIPRELAERLGLV